MRRKASLQLSINAIVVLILAITMLGLGLAFMKNIFGGVSEKFGVVTAEMEKEMAEKLQNSPERVTFNIFRMDVKRGDDENVYMGIKNDLDHEQKFNIKIKCKGGIKNPAAPADECCPGVCVKTFATQTVPSGDVRVLPVKIETNTAAKADTYKFEIKVCDGENANCPDATTYSYFERQEVYVNVMI